MVTTAAKVEWTVVNTESRRCSSNTTGSREFDPRFNVRYRDDKSYPVLAVTLNEEYPRLFVYRGPRRKGVRYFGPYSHAWAIRGNPRPAQQGLSGAHLLPQECSSGTVRFNGRVCSAISTSVRRPASAG